jgi:hypothetical protein
MVNILPFSLLNFFDHHHFLIGKEICPCNWRVISVKNKKKSSGLHSRVRRNLLLLFSEWIHKDRHGVLPGAPQIPKSDCKRFVIRLYPGISNTIKGLWRKSMAGTVKISVLSNGFLKSMLRLAQLLKELKCTNHIDRESDEERFLQY